MINTKNLEKEKERKNSTHSRVWQKKI